jgi:Na+-translocating ferredoxin:NAD+ oxidoreductase RNF subunit RnfB
MNVIIFAVVSVTVIGIICAIMLAVASKVMAVKTDERTVHIRECLPGANCGACGYAGCDGYASALTDGSGIKTNLCVPGGDTVSKQISDILGVGFEDVIEKIAVIHCAGDCNATTDKMNYSGIKSCAASKLFFGGKGACSYGCIGFGDCAAVCPNNAICIESGIALINTRLCNGCGLCVGVCPSRIITIEPDTVREAVLCSNQDKGAAIRNKCSRGCIACKKCERECPTGAIIVVNNLAKIDYEKCIQCGKCVDNCPVGCIFETDYKGIHSVPQEKITASASAGHCN